MESFIPWWARGGRYCVRGFWHCKACQGMCCTRQLGLMWQCLTVLCTACAWYVVCGMWYVQWFFLCAGMMMYNVVYCDASYRNWAGDFRFSCVESLNNGNIVESIQLISQTPLALTMTFLSKFRYYFLFPKKKENNNINYVTTHHSLKSSHSYFNNNSNKYHNHKL